MSEYTIKATAFTINDGKNELLSVTIDYDEHTVTLSGQDPCKSIYLTVGELIAVANLVAQVMQKPEEQKKGSPPEPPQNVVTRNDSPEASMKIGKWEE